MKQFDLEEYLKNPKRKVVARDGDSVRIMCTDYYGKKPIIAKIGECEYSYSFYEDGKFLSYGEPSHLDLFFAPEKEEGWLNLYKNDNGHIYTGGVYSSKEEAEEYLNKKGYLATIKIEWEE